MYRIVKYADCWAIHNLDSDLSRRLTEDEVQKVREEIPSLDDPMTASYFCDEVECLEDKP